MSDWKNWFDTHIGKNGGLIGYLWEVWVYNTELIYDIRGNRIQPPASVLEIGCGSGLELLSVLAAQGYEATGLDIESDVLEFAKENFQKLGLNAQFILGDMMTAEPGQKYDLVYSQGVIEHFIHKDKIIEAVKAHKRLSRKWVIMTVPSKYIYEEDKRKGNLDFTPDWVPLTFEDLEEVVKAAGLTLVSRIGYGDVENSDNLSLNKRREIYRTGKAKTLGVVCTV